MSERTMSELLEALVQRRAVEEQHCREVGADLQEALAMAKVCSVQIAKLAEEYPSDWWPRLQRESARRRERFLATWQGAVKREFRSVLLAGDGPVSAFDLGMETVRSHVRPGLLKRCDEWEPSQGGLLLTGASEVGKTMALLALAWRLHELANHEPPAYAPYLDQDPRCPVVWTQAVKLARQRDTWVFGTARPPFEVACEEADLLVIDDLLFARHRVDVILEVVSSRMNHGRPTFTSSGFGVEELAEQLGDAGLRRLTHCGAAAGAHLAVTKGTRK